jgi:4-hydroxybenzoate polyprenyltransferase
VLKKIFDFFVFTSLFIAVCAVLMVYQTSYLFGIPLSIKLAGFVFFGSVCSYNFHWYLTPPNVSQPSVKTKWNINYKYVHLALFVVALIAAAIFTFMLIQHWIWLGVTAFLTFMYSAPKLSFPLFINIRKIAIGKTIFLAFAWAHITAFLPLIISLKQLQPQHIWFVVNRFFYIYAICIIFDRRDVVEDRKAGIKSLITYLDDKGIDRLFWCSMSIFLISTIVLGKYFSVATIIALLIPGIILGFLYYPSKKSSSDYLYYFILDGMMMLSAPLLLLFKFVG